MADEIVNQEDPKQQPASDVTTVNNGGSGVQQQGTDQSDPKWLDGRLARAKEQARKEFLAELGFDDPNEAKSLLTDAKAKREAEKTETQKLQDALEKQKAKADAAEQRAAQIEAARIQDKVDGAIKAAASDAKAVDADDVLSWARKYAVDDVAAVMNADGEIDKAAAKKLTERARKEKPHFFLPSGPGSPSNRGGQNPDPTKIDKPKNGKSLFSL